MQVKARLSDAGVPAVRAKLSALLEAALRGLANNTTAAPQDVLVFVSGVLEAVVPAEAAAMKHAEAAAEAASRGEGTTPSHAPILRMVTRGQVDEGSCRKGCPRCMQEQAQRPLNAPPLAGQH